MRKRRGMMRHILEILLSLTMNTNMERKILIIHRVIRMSKTCLNRYL